MAGKSVSWRRDPLILDRMRTVEREHLAGKSNVAIAEQLRVDEATVRNDLKRLNELWLEHTKLDQETLRAEAMAKLEDVRLRAISAYDFDRRMEEAVMTGGTFMTAAGDAVKIHRDEKDSAQFRGNKSAALNVARSATMDQAKIAGVVVDKVSPTDAKGNTLDLTTLLQRARENRAKRESDADASPS